MTKQQHGFSRHKLYETHKNMIQRTENKSHPLYKYYGARGIKVCDEWRIDKASFFKWAINGGYKDGLSIDRIDNNKGYSPDNCRWADKSTQTRNTRVIHRHNTSGFRGVGFHKVRGKYRAYIKLNGKSKHIGHFDDPKHAAMAYDTFVIIYGLEHTTNFPKGVFA